MSIRYKNVQAPVIISASRSTDIPAFFPQWFIDRLRAGYTIWINPFNRQPTYVSFENTKVVVFWSKNPKPLIPHLKELDDKGIHYYFQFTLNDYDREGFEPNVPPVKERIDTFRHLSELIGKEKVIWRFDPLILTNKTGVDELLQKIESVGNQLKNYTSKLVFSFADIGIYKKVQANLKRQAIPYREFDEPTMDDFASKLHRLNKNWNFALATCAESVHLEQYGIEHNRCIDGELIKKLFPDVQNKILGLKKDKGQRKACGCVISKDIGRYNTCPHFCVYCYANTSKESVNKKIQKL